LEIASVAKIIDSVLQWFRSQGRLLVQVRPLL
jgi:hypothetical protein